jgi:hypothetical protein
MALRNPVGTVGCQQIITDAGSLSSPETECSKLNDNLSYYLPMWIERQAMSVAPPL